MYNLPPNPTPCELSLLFHFTIIEANVVCLTNWNFDSKFRSINYYFFSCIIISIIIKLKKKDENLLKKKKKFQFTTKKKKICSMSLPLYWNYCSILGMYLFGGKFCKFMDEELGERECSCVEIITKHPLCECDRKHFNNFLWATVTVFQVSLTFVR